MLELEVTNQLGVIVGTSRALDAGSWVHPLVIDVDDDPAAKRPVGPKTASDLADLGDDWPREVAALRSRKVDADQLATSPLGALARRVGLPQERLAALRLHSQMLHAAGFGRHTAEALASIGIASREDLAGASPPELMEVISRTFPSERKSRRFSPSTVYGWVGYAKGIDPTPFATRMPLRSILTNSRVITDAVTRIAPEAAVIEVRGLLNPFNRFLAVAEARALMDAAGVGDLSSLGTFHVRGRRVIHPGYYVAWPQPELLLPNFSTPIVASLIKVGGGFQKLASVRALDDALHLVPNPVTDAVIIGSLVDFAESGRLVIGKEVSSLTIITEEILYSQVNEITCEDRERAPAARAAMVPNRAATGSPANDRNVYSPGSGNRGRDGGTGSNGVTGAAGFDGDVLGAAPAVTIYVQRTPQGLPDLRLGGRRGGAGQPGQHGGHGSDGARGREACSGACYCHRRPGHGGNGGDGGTGGTGGSGGAGGSASALKICTLAENIPALATGRPFFIDIAGGGGGNGGSGGTAGEGGRGGAAGDDSWPWCEEEPSRVGRDGARGSDGRAGPDGRRGNDGQFTLQPITLSDWNAVFNQPWIVRLEPWTGAAGTRVRVVARNITSDTRVVLDGSVIVPSTLDVSRGWLEFVVPLTTSGGQRQVQLRVPGVNGPLFSNTVTFRVLPTLTSLSPAAGVPGVTIVLRGSGFVAGAQVRFAGLTMPAQFTSPSQLSVTLPDHENITLGEGVHSVEVVNPDGHVSGSLTFALTLTVRVRVKAWRVFPDLWIGGGGLFGGPGPGRDDDDVRQMLIDSPNPIEVWLPHQIALDIDPAVGVAVVPADWAESWPIDGVTFDENQAVIRALDSDGNFRHFDPGAVNFYFVDDIDDWTTHAYTYLGSETRRQGFVIYEDTPLLSAWEEAHVAAHELGHVFGLPHVCGDESDVTFGRTCNQANDKDFLMYPSTNLFTDEGNTLTVAEAAIARRVARLWHGR
ncbi:MAG TPA: DUF4332 domain-containing protein [Candidatus Limnocylindrales bacterium]|nr:DUF4332 domain-containing protein [Candidatus Limnocylindrales bacterium]